MCQSARSVLQEPCRFECRNCRRRVSQLDIGPDVSLKERILAMFRPWIRMSVTVKRGKGTGARCQSGSQIMSEGLDPNDHIYEHFLRL